ncbi:hypothetical protein [Paenibacillus pini]|uniref:Uncharacterized protein n=1 Tax=Paenibacillus pini JCM 16418 TaxID=1236976 RepID=W7Z8G8_9BACL|nr:hypothetical protein [Paenibacillus pini]GAF10714.1 hypothetical protein JCM16418_4933 [Paenibacillus pini JCM 16418]
MKREYYVIELTNGEFASFHQETDTDLNVTSWSVEKIHNADFLDEETAKVIFDDLIHRNSSWEYYGECLEPEIIRKLEIQLFDKMNILT